MPNLTRRQILIAAGALLARAAERLPANKNVRWAVGANLWKYFPPVPFTDILDVMRDTGFIGLRFTQFPGILKKYDLTVAQIDREMSKRGLHAATISFGGAADDVAQHAKILADAKTAMEFLKQLGAKDLVVFSPNRDRAKGSFETMCSFYNRLGETAGEMGFRAGLHPHLHQMVESAAEIDRCMALTDPKLFGLAPDTAHVYLAGADPVAVLEKHKHRLMFLDYKDAKRADLKTDYRPNIFDLGDGELDFPACHRILKDIGYRGWNCVDLDIARNGPRVSYQRCAAYVVNKLEPIYV